MKATGIIRKLDKLGRIVLPRELRNGFAMEPGTPVEIFVADNGIFLQKYETTCTFCGFEDDLICYRGKWICQSCRAEIAQTESPEDELQSFMNKKY